MVFQNRVYSCRHLKNCLAENEVEFLFFGKIYSETYFHLALGQGFVGTRGTK